MMCKLPHNNRYNGILLHDLYIYKYTTSITLLTRINYSLSLTHFPILLSLITI
jgi:hypothetical protein